ncbi:hypothetical protein J6590_013698 [Homalodisca vitripennis]|nr:hypothetical protein J6590_013698 [Homalodisca vitripennis]
MLSKDLSAYTVIPLWKAGIKCVVVDYDLVPSVTLDAIVEEIKELAVFVLNMAKENGSKNVWFGGHSAGAHLTASLLEPDWFNSLEPGLRQLIKGVVLISGIFDTTALIHTSENVALQLTDAIGFVRPGGRSKQVLNMENIESEIQGPKDILVMICGTNDVARNESQEALNCISDTLQQCKEKNVVLVDLPNRYDLANWSCVNEETRRTNSALKDLMSTHKNLKIVEGSRAEREMHTHQGMHFNTKGKQWLAEQIITAIQEFNLEQPIASAGGRQLSPRLRDLTTQEGNGQPPPPGTSP